jgi:carbon starvation protein
MLWNMFHSGGGWFWNLEKSWHLFLFGVIILGLQVWMIIEGILIWPRAKGVLEDELPPLEQPGAGLADSAGRSC